MSLKIGILGSDGARGTELQKHFKQQGASVIETANTDDEAMILFESKEIESIVISTPDFLHEEHACRALESGKDVFLEKPMAITPDGCDRIMTTAEENGRILYVGHNLRHFTVIRELKKLIDEGIIGGVKTVLCQHFVSYGHWAYFKKGRWHKRRENVGSLLIHKGSHDLDIIHWLAGSTTRYVQAMGKLMVFQNAPDRPDVEDISSVSMEMHNGVLATYDQCCFAHLTCREYTVVGTLGTLRNRGDNPQHAVIELHKNNQNHSSIPVAEYRFEAENGFHGKADERIVREFIGVISGTTSSTISVQDAANAVKTAYTATQSLRQGGRRMTVV